MRETIDEPVRVGAVFGAGRIRPVWFIWSGRKYQVNEITYAWKEREGSALLQHFSVTSGADVFDLCFSSRTMSWRLLKVDSDG